MSALSLFGLAKVSGTLVIDAQGKLTILPEGTEPRPGDVVINVLNDTEVGEDIDLVLIQEDGENQEIDVSDIDAEEIIAAIEAGEDPTQNEEQATAAGEANGSSPTTTGAIERDDSQTLAKTQFDTSGLEAQGLTATQSNTLLQVLVNSAPQILSEALAGNVVEAGHNSDGSDFDGTAELTGQLSATDLEFDDATLTWDVISTPDNLSDFGEFELADNGQWTFRLNNDSDATQALNVNDTVTLSFTVQVTDPLNSSTSQPFVITITGTNDKPVISANSEISGDVVEAGHNDDGSENIGTASVSGQLNATDVDSPVESLVWSKDGDVSSTYGDFSITEAGFWTFELDNTADEVQALREGQSTSLEFKVKVTDDQGVDVFQTIVINIQGTNDKPVIDSELVTEGEVRESGHFDNGTEDAGAPSTGGQLSATDVDSSNLTWSPVGDVSNPYGTFSITSDGLWSFVIDNEAGAVEALAEGDEVPLSFTVQVEDEQGAVVTQTISVTVKGTNDAPVIDSAKEIGRVREAGDGVEGKDVTRGRIEASDVDNGSELSYSVQDGGNTDYGTFSVNDNGRWKFELDNDSEMTDALAKGEKVTLNYVVVVTDEHGAEVTQAVSIIVKGTNDAPVIDSAKDIGRVREAGDGVEGKDVTRGRIEASDVDNGSELSYSVQDGGNTDYGTFSVNDNGRWKFELDNDSEMTDALAKGEKVTLNYVVVVTDEHGAEVTQAVSIIVKGTNDAPVIDSAKDIGRVREAGDGVEGKDVTRGRIEASDVDNGSELSYSVQDGGNTDYGTFSVNDNGRWKFELDNDSEMTDALAKGEKVTLNYVVVVTDEHGAEVTQAVSIIVKGTNDAPVIDSAKDIGRVREAGDGVEGKDVTRGRIEASDVDNGSELSYSVQDGGNTDYGTFSVNDNGRWKFELDNDSEMTDALAKGEKVTLNYVVVVTDEHGAEVTQAVSIIVKGTNDAPVIDSAKDIGRVREAGDGVEGKDVTRGRIEASDVDNGSELSYSVQDGGNTDYGTFSVNDNGRWKFELDNDSEMTDALAKGEKVTLNYVVVVTDEHGAEVTQAVSIIVKGTNDAPVIDSAKDIGRVREAGDGVEGKDVTRGRIEASDVDNGSELSYSVQDGGNTDYGTFSVNDNGRWKFELDNNLEATQQLTDGDKVRLEYTVIVTDEHGASVEQLVTIIVKGTNDGPASEDFSITLFGDDAIPVIFDTGEGSIEGDGTDHISDYEDDRSTTDGKSLSVVITELPLGGTLLYTENGETRAIVEADLHVEGGANGTPFNPDNISYLPDESAQGFVLGVKDSQGLDSEASSQTDFLNWGSPGNNPGERILTLGDDSIRITSIGGDLTQYRGDANHVGFGLGVGGGQGINEGETISIDFSERPATSVTLGLDGLGGYFDENINNANESSVLVTVTLSDGSTRVLDPIQKTTSGNSDLDLDITISIDDLSGAEGLQIYGVTVGTEGNGNWELRYLETSLEDSFDYKALDSDGAYSDESTVTIDDQRTNLAPDAIDDPESYSLVQGDMGAGDQGWDMVDSIQAKYDGQTVNYNIDGTDRIGIPDGTTNGGPESQIQYNRNEEESEQLIITLKEPAVDGAFSVTNLFANEGGAGSHEQGKWSAYLGDTLVASDYFHNESGNKGTFDIETGGFAYDKLVFESVDFTGGPARGTDSSDYFLQGIEVVGAGAYVFDHDEPVVIPLSELLSNDDAVDGDDIRITYVFGETQGDARIEGGNVIFDLPEGFAGRTEFQYQITDDKDGFDTATVNVLVNPGPISVSGFEIGTASVEEGESFSYNVTLDGSTNVKTFFDIEFGANGDEASANDVDPSTMTFSNGVTYNEVTGELEVPANVSDFTITLPTIDDNRYEGDEGFTLVVDGQTVTGDIQDNDPITLSLSGGGEVSEDAGSVPFTLSLSNPSDVDLTVALDRLDVDTDDDDFTTTTASYNDGTTNVPLQIVNGQITIPAGVTSVNIQVGIQDNDVYEQDENFTLTVTEPAGLTVNGNVGVSAGATISDDGQLGGQSGGDNDNLAPTIDLNGEDYEIVFESERAGYSNVFGYFYTDSQGNPTDPVVLIHDTNAGLANDQLLAELDSKEGLEFFLIANGANQTPDDAVLSFNAQGDLLVNGQIPSKPVYLSTEDSVQYQFTVSGVDDGALEIRVEDIAYDESDKDFNDLVVTLRPTNASDGTGYTTTFSEGDDPVVIVDQDVTVTDDIDVITRAEITLTNAQSGDSIALAAAAVLASGLTITHALGSDTIVISGTGSASDYEAALKWVEFSNDSEDPSAIPRQIEIKVFDDQNIESNTAISTINVVPINDGPESESFSFSITDNDVTPVVFDTTRAAVDGVDSGDGDDHISDIEDDLNSEQVLVAITELPIGGTLYHDGEEITQTNVANGDTFDPTKITYEPDSDAQGFILGTKVVPTSSDMESTQEEFYNWGTAVDGKNRVLELSNTDGSTDNININSNKGNLTQYRGDIQDNHVGHGLGIGGGQGINEGEWLSINFEDRPATHVNLGLDGMGGYFYSDLGGRNESAVTIKVTLSNGDTVDYTPDVQKDTSGNDVLFHELSFSVDDLGVFEGRVLIEGVSVGTDGRGNWELRYLETALNDSFKYKAVDSDEGESTESVVTIVDERENNMPPTLDLDLSADGTSFDTNYQEGDSAIDVVDSDITIFDEKNVIHEAEIVLTNPKADDNFGIDGATNPLLSGISYTTELLDSGAIKITLSGEATPADYEAAIQLIEFSNSSQSPDDEDRIIEITIFDDAMQPSNTAVSTINFTAIADLVVAAAIGDEDNKIALDIQLPANSDATKVVISGIPDGAILFSGTDEIVVTNNAANILPSQLANLSIKPPQDSDVDFTLSVSGRDAGDNVVEQHDLAVTVRPITDAPTLIVTGENIVSAINFENVNLGNSSWKGNISGAQLSVDTPDDLNSGDWGVITNRGEVGKEGVYLGNGEQNQIFEIEGRSGQQDSLFTSFKGTPGQFYELNFDAAARRSDSPMDIKLEKETSSGVWVEVETLRSYGSGEEHSLVVRDWSEDEQLFFQTLDSFNYRVVFESPEQNSYGALLDNIVLSTRSNVGYEDTFIDISDISASLNDTDGSEVLTLLIQGLPQGAIVTNGTQTSIIGPSGEVDISDWSDLNDLQIKVADVGTYPITIKAIASELDGTYSPVDEVVSESINLVVLDNPEPSASNTPPEVIDFEFFAPDDTIPLNFADFATDSEDDASNTKATLVEITDEPEYGQLYFLSNSGERFDLDVGDVVEDSVDIFYDLEVGFDVSALGYNPQGDEPFGNDIVVTGGTYDGDKPHLGVEMEEIAFDSAGAAKQSGFYTKRDDERGQGKETEAKQSEFMSIKFTAGMMTRALVGVGSLTGQFSAAANGNGAAQVFVYLYAGGVLLDDNPIVMDNGVIDDHQAIIEVASDIPFDEMRIMPFNAEGKDAGFVLQSVKVTDGEVADQFDYRAIDSDGLPSLETATVNVNIMPNGNVDESEEVDYAVQGGSGVTVIHGTDGDDVLSGGLGNDVLTGGLGDDTFKWSEGDLDGSHDVITDFSQVEGNRDVIDLSEVFEDSNTSLEALLDNVAVGGDKITLTENDDNTSTLVNVTKGDKSVTIELEGVTGLSELDVQQLSNIIIIHDT
ncbi:VCBS domain-containing protein [Vibrio mediterranei]|uniref:Tandem-95 repeat protein n=1 Tax=Vibrio mediterranei TaxID=689 RepID=A0A3G4VJJ0_9VIBR|nr:VCBS domain-containing protein [Vibrio mediterranei]AYV23772.1 tandem-95 repeat protein [Vibrio mediterranei]